MSDNNTEAVNTAEEKALTDVLRVRREKLAELSKQKEQTLAQMNAILGAAQTLTELLSGKEKTE